MMNQYIYNAYVIRFRPYQDIGEFVNIGILAVFPQFGKFTFKLESKTKRLTTFFPEIRKEELRKFYNFMKARLEAVTETTAKYSDTDTCFVFDFVAKDVMCLFTLLTSLKEGVFTFGDTLTGLTQDVDQQADVLFKHYVRRNFKNNGDSKEERLQASFQNTLKNFNYAAKFKQEMVGNDLYRIHIPFNNEHLAIKTLSFDRETTKIYEHGDNWISKVHRLRKTANYSVPLLFPIDYPKNKNASAEQAVAEFESGMKEYKDVIVVPVADTEKIKSNINRYIS